jgi:hypothetical protein
MADINFIDSPIEALDALKETGKAIPDPYGSSTVYYKPSEEELKALNADFHNEVALAEQEMEPLRQKALRNERSYMLVDESPDGTFFTYPLVKRDVDFNAAWLVSSVIRPEPILSIDPTKDKDYQVVTEDPEYGAVQVAVPAERAVQELELGVEYILRELIELPRLLQPIAKEVKMGKGPVWVKMGWNPRDRYERAPKTSKGLNPWNVIVDSGKWAKKTDPFPIKWVPKSIYDMLYRTGFDNPEDLPWIGEKLQWGQAQFADLITSYPEAVLLTPEQLEAARQSQPVSNPVRDQSRGLTGTRATQSFYGVPLVELYFTLPIRYEAMDEEGKQFKKVEVMEMGGFYHTDLHSFVCIWFNDFAHQRKPYIPFFNDKVPFQIADTASVDELVPIQAWVTEALTLTLENKALANNSGFLIKEDSPAWDFFGANKLEPGFRAPATDGQDITPVTFGRDASSMIPEIEWLIDKADDIGEVRRGERVPGRTSPNTVAQIMQSAIQKDLMTLYSFEWSLRQLMIMTLQVYRQFNPYGQNVEAVDEEGNPKEIPFRVPLDMDIYDLRIRLTAASELSQRESGFEDLIMIMDKLDQDSRGTAEVLKALVDARITPGLAAAFERMITRKQSVLDSLLSKVRIDSRKMVIDKDMLGQIAQERDAMRQQMMGAQAQGGMDGGGQQVPGDPGQNPMGNPQGGDVPM